MKAEEGKAYLPVVDFQETTECVKQELELSSDMLEVTKKGTARLKTMLSVPKEWRDKCIYLRFDQTGCITRVEINDNYVGQHYGGYTTWDMEITAFVKTGSDNKLVLTLMEDRTSMNPYEIIGIHGKITLLCLPENHIKDVAIATSIQKEEATVHIKVQGRSFNDPAFAVHKTACGCKIFDKDNRIVAEKIEKVAEATLEMRMKITNPDLWSASHPDLYKVQLDWFDHGSCQETAVVLFGIRTVAVKEQELCINDIPVKLKGVCIKEPHGKGSFEKLTKDLLRLKEANVNYLRVMYYPASTQLLSLCDELGFYVQEQASVHCVDQINTAMASTQNAPEYRGCYLNQFKEMLQRDKNHPSILIWSLGSESTFGSNMKAMYTYCREYDPSRLLNFSYPMSIPEEEIRPDLWSLYHPDVRLDFAGHYDQFIIFHTPGSDNEIGYQVGFAPEETMPVIFDAYARIPADCRDERKRDPAIHEFWGESIYRFHEKIRATKGCVGGSIESLYDEIFATEEEQLPAIMYERETGLLTPEGYEKPEFYHMKKAFDDTQAIIAMDKSEQSIVEHGKAKELELSLAEDIYSVKDGDITYTFDKGNGYLLHAFWGDETIIEKGPMLITTGLTLGDWQDASIEIFKMDCNVRVLLTGWYGTIVKVCYTIDIFQGGKLHTEYEILDLHQPMPHRVKINIGVTPGGVDEFGVSYQLPGAFEEVAWERKTRFQDYPADHIGRPKGSAKRSCTNADFSGSSVEPVLYGPYDLGWKGCNDFRALRFDCSFYKIASFDTQITATCSTSTFAARPMIIPKAEACIDDRDDRIVYHGTWFEMNDACGNYKGTETLSREAGASAEVKFTGTGICIYGPSDMIYGKSRVYLDDKIVAEGIDQYPSRAELSGMSRGYEKRYRTLIFAADNLKKTEHTIRIEVMGEKQNRAQECYVSLDEFVILDQEDTMSVQLLLLQDFQYNRMVYGNYRKEPILFETGSKGQIDLLIEKQAK